MDDVDSLEVPSPWPVFAPLVSEHGTPVGRASPISKESFNDSESLKMKCVGLNVKICEAMVRIQVRNCGLMERFCMVVPVC